MKRYEVYKPSGVSWFGDIPSHWKVVKLRQILHPVSEKNHPSLPLLSVVRERGVIVRDINDKESNHNYVPDDLSGYKLVKEGQFAMNKMKAWQGSYGVSQYTGIVSPAYFVFDLDLVEDKDFFHYAIRSKTYVDFFAHASDGVRVGQWDLSLNKMKEIPFAIPPTDEQLQIVKYLNWQIKEIRKVIGAKKKQIALLREQEHSIIQDSIFGGIDGAEKTSCDINWINKIPKNWKTTRIKYLFDMRDERNYKPLSEVNLLSLYTGKGVVQNVDIEYKSGNKARTADNYKIVHVDDIVVNIILCWMGSIGRSNYNGVTSPAYDVYVPRDNICSRYYHYLFRLPVFSDECKKVGHGIMAMRWRTYSPEFRNIYVPEAPYEEQIKIADWLDERLKVFEDCIKALEKEITLLHELRTKLISEVVTGQIDVRDIEVPEYECAEEIADDEFDENNDLRSEMENDEDE